MKSRLNEIERPQEVGKTIGRRAAKRRLNAVAAYQSLALPSADKAACAELGTGRADGAKINRIPSL